MIKVEPNCGDSIQYTANSMLANCTPEEDVTAIFNGITLVAKYGMGWEQIVQEYHDTIEKRSQDYRNSPEGQAFVQQRQAEKAKSQQKIDAAMIRLTTLDFEDLGAVIGWLTEIRDPSDDGVKVPSAEIISTFADHGYFMSVNCGEDFNGEDKENYARWLIGQALSGLKEVGAIHQVFHKFADDWKTKFKVK